MKAMYSRAIRMTTSGTAIDRPTTVVSFSVTAPTTDTLVNLRDGGASGPIMWTLEGDNATSSTCQTFNPALKFDRNVYIEFVGSGALSCACIAVVEP